MPYLFALLMMALIGGYEIAGQSADPQQQAENTTGFAASYAQNMLAYHQAAQEWLAKNPGFQGEIPRDQVYAAMQSIDMTINIIGPWRSVVDDSGVLATWMDGKVKVLPGYVGAALARMTVGDVGSGVAMGGQLRSSSDGVMRPLPTTVRLPDWTVVYASNVVSKHSTSQAQTTVKTYSVPCPFPETGAMTYMEQVTIAADGTQTFGAPIKTGSTCDPGIQTAEYQVQACDAPLIGLMMFRRTVNHQSGVVTPGPWQPAGETCRAAANARLAVAPINPTGPLNNQIATTEETATVACPPPLVGTQTYERTVTTYATTFGSEESYGDWMSVDSNCVSPASGSGGGDPNNNGGGNDGSGSAGAGTGGDGSSGGSCGAGDGGSGCGNGDG